jgi:hypothetical protein
MSEEKSIVINVTGENATVILHAAAPSFGLCQKESETEDLKEDYQGIATFGSTGSPRR